MSFDGVVRAFGIPFDTFRDVDLTAPLSDPVPDVSLGVVYGEHGIATPILVSSSVAVGASVSESARVLFAVPPGASSTITADSAILVTARLTAELRASDEASILHLSMFVSDNKGGLGAGAVDLLETADHSIHSTEWLDYAFWCGVTDPSWCVDGAMLDLRLTMGLDNASGDSASQLQIGRVAFQQSMRFL